MAPMCGPLHPGIEREKRTNCCGSRIVRLHRWKYHRPAILGSKKIHPLMLRGCHFAELCTLVGRSTRPALGCGSRSSQLHTNDRCVPYFSPGPSSGIRRPTMYHVVLSVLRTCNIFSSVSLSELCVAILPATLLILAAQARFPA